MSGYGVPDSSHSHTEPPKPDKIEDGFDRTMWKKEYFHYFKESEYWKDNNKKIIPHTYFYMHKRIKNLDPVIGYTTKKIQQDGIAQ